MANPGRLDAAHFGFLRRELGGAALAARHALARRGGLPGPAELGDVLEWLDEAYGTLDKRQRDAGWAWMLGEARTWIQRRRLEIESAASGPWRVPFASDEDRGWIARPITSAVALWDEARAMRHCVFDPLERSRTGDWLAVSVREARCPDRRVATAVLARGVPGYAVREVRGFANADPPPAASAGWPPSTPACPSFHPLNKGRVPRVIDARGAQAASCVRSHCARPCGLPRWLPTSTGVNLPCRSSNRLGKPWTPCCAIHARVSAMWR